MSVLRSLRMNTPAGGLRLAGCAAMIHEITWEGVTPDHGDMNDEKPFDLLFEAKRQLEQYFKGERKKFDLPLYVKGTPFQRKVWSCLGQVPYGETLSYKDLARLAGNPKAFRAVGGANGKNPLSIIVPCHRVVASDGKIGGYAGGIEAKRALLEHEGGGQILLI